MLISIYFFFYKRNNFLRDGSQLPITMTTSRVKGASCHDNTPNRFSDPPKHFSNILSKLKFTSSTSHWVGEDVDIFLKMFKKFHFLDLSWWLICLGNNQISFDCAYHSLTCYLDNHLTKLMCSSLENISRYRNFTFLSLALFLILVSKLNFAPFTCASTLLVNFSRVTLLI